jgi:hypothetical protein
MSLTKLSVGGNNDVMYKLIPPRESFVSDIPVRTEISKSFFLGCKQIWPGELALFQKWGETGMRKSYAKVINKIYYLYRISQQVIEQMLIIICTAKLHITLFGPQKQLISLVNLWETEIQESSKKSDVMKKVQQNYTKHLHNG